MSTSVLTYENSRAALLERLTGYVELTKPRISAMVLVAVATAAFAAGWGPPDALLLVHTIVGTALVAASASALNQYLERHSDGRMERTADRPLPSGRLSIREVLTFGAVTAVAGLVYLAAVVNVTTALLGLVTWVLYVWIYTPLKSRSTVNTPVGAVAGAMPVLMGWASVGAPLDLHAFTLFVILFLWQFPHFMAIAWLYRSQYASAGLKMLSVVDPTGKRAGAQAVLSALALLPVSVLPCVLQVASGTYFGWTLLLGLGQLACAVAFLVRLDEVSARRLLRASLVYLPAVLLLWMLAPLV